MRNQFIGIAGLALVAIAAPVEAHHSAAIFDFTKPMTVKGVVRKFEVINPHTHVTLVISDRKGRREVEFEGHSASNFFRAGYTRGSVKAGDTISITIAPMRDGSDGGFILSFVTPGGKVVGFSPV
jgi:hypothetical protein